MSILFIADISGQIVQTVQTPVAQGSMNADRIMLLAPIPQNTQVTLTFELPNGVRLVPQLANGQSGYPLEQLLDPQTMQPVPLNNVWYEYTENGQIAKASYSVWFATLNAKVTAVAGAVKAQFMYYTAGTDASTVIAGSSEATFTVGKGVPPIQGTVEDPTTLEQVLDLMNQVLASIAPLIAGNDQNTADIASLKTDVGTLKQDVTDAQNDINQNASDIGNLTAELNNLSVQVQQNTQTAEEASRNAQLALDLLGGSIISVASVTDAYSMRETAGGLNVADGVKSTVKLVTGSTVKTTNVIDLSGASGTVSGVTISANNNVLNFSGVPSNNYSILASVDTSLLRDGVYTFSQSQYFASNQAKNAVYFSIRRREKNTSSYTNVANTATGAAAITFDFSTYDYVVYIISGGYAYSDSDEMNATLAFMCNEGSEEKPYVPFFAGLSSAQFAGVISTGKNIIDLSGASGTVSGVTIEAENNSLSFYGIPTGTYRSLYSVEADSFENGATYTFSQDKYFGPSGTAHTVQNAVYWQINRYDRFTGARLGVVSTPDGPKTITFNKDLYNYTVFITTGSYAYSAGNPLGATISFMTSLGTSALAYEEYKKDESFILENGATVLGEWDVLNPSEESENLIKATEIVTFYGQEAWRSEQFSATAYLKETTLSVVPVFDSGLPSAICNYYALVEIGNVVGRPYSFGINANGVLLINDPNYYEEDTSAWIAHLAAIQAKNPLTIAYKRSPTVYTETIPNGYTAWRDGSETVNQGGTDTAKNGALCTIEQEYFTVVTGGATA